MQIFRCGVQYIKLFDGLIMSAPKLLQLICQVWYASDAKVTRYKIIWRKSAKIRQTRKKYYDLIRYFVTSFVDQSNGTHGKTK